MTTLNNYYEEIRTDIAKEFGLEAGGYYHSLQTSPVLSFNQAMLLNAKYPNPDEYSLSPSDKAMLIAKRYASLKKVWSK
jgi:hypothetical protein